MNGTDGTSGDGASGSDARYWFAEYSTDYGSYAVVHDEQNHDAWIESSEYVPVVR